MIYKFTKCESVIAKIMADADMSEKSMRVTDIREWIFEAVEKIGAPMLYVEKESGVDGCPIFKLEDCQIAIPDDLNHLTAVAYSKEHNGPFIPARTNDSIFKHQDGRMHHLSHHHYHPIQQMLYKKPTTLSEFYGVNLMKHSDRIVDNQDDITFFIKPGWIVLNKRDGYVKLSYKAIATDERGYPLIPDMASYQEAIYWYVMMKLTFPKWLNGSFLNKKTAKGAEYAYTYIQLQWNFYRNQAYAEAMMPTESDMRSIKNEWNKLVPEWDSDDIFFKSEGTRQLNYTDYYYGY